MSSATATAPHREAAPRPRPVPAEPWARFDAFGCEALIAVEQPAALGEALASVERVVADFDRACSRFRADSELNALNTGAGGPPVAVSALLFDALAAGLRAARLTDGDVDPTVGGALVALGYDRDFDQLASAPPRPARIVPAPGWRVVALDPERRTVALPRGVMLDLGATAKALAADRAAAAANVSAGCGVLVGFGGDFALAGAPPEHGWRIRVTDDHRAGPAAPGQTIVLRGGGLASSSTTVRRWAGSQGPLHHLLDPATGACANGPWRTVSVCAASCLDANIASTAAVLRGERAIAWLQSLALPSRLVGRDGAVRHLAGWPREGEELA